MYVWTYSTGTLAKNVWHTANPTSAGFQAAGNWYGVLTAILSIAGIVWGFLYSHAKATSRKRWYSVGLLLGGIGLITVSLAQSKALTVVAFILFGCSYFTIHNLPFTMLTSSLNGVNEGSYIGLFNIGICMPQIIASLLSFVIFHLTGKNQPVMLLIAGISMLIAAILVWRIHEGVKASKATKEAAVA